MADNWTGKLDTYLDGELSTTEMRELDTHLRGCPDCAAEVLSRLQLKRSVQSAGKRYTANADFRERLRRQVASRPQRSPIRLWLAAIATLAAFVVIGLFAVSLRQQQLARQHVFGEIADLHVATLASSNPVDVVSTDRHTVKPWFQGKIPFSFNLPELQNSEFTLVGGRVTYLDQTPGAELIYQIRKHQISVFIFPQRPINEAFTSGVQRQETFNVESWSQEGLLFFVIGDAGGDDIRNLASLLKKAAAS